MNCVVWRSGRADILTTSSPAVPGAFVDESTKDWHVDDMYTGHVFQCRLVREMTHFYYSPVFKFLSIAQLNGSQHQRSLFIISSSTDPIKQYSIFANRNSTSKTGRAINFDFMIHETIDNNKFANGCGNIRALLYGLKYSKHTTISHSLSQNHWRNTVGGSQ